MKNLLNTLLLTIGISNIVVAGYEAEFIFGNNINTRPITKPINIQSINLSTAKVGVIKIDDEVIDGIDRLKTKTIMPGQILRIKILDLKNNIIISSEDKDAFTNGNLPESKIDQLFQSIVFRVDQQDVPLYWTQRSAKSLLCSSQSNKISWNGFMRSLPRFDKKKKIYQHVVEFSFLQQE